jgi:hypothetical protein
VSGEEKVVRVSNSTLFGDIGHVPEWTDEVAPGFGAISATVVARPRRRSKWVCRLDAVLAPIGLRTSDLLKGRWTPDLPSGNRNDGTNLMLAHFGDGARILGGGLVQVQAGEGEGMECKSHTYLVLELSDGSRETIFPELVCALASFAFLRERSATLVSALRLRALEWYKKNRLSQVVVWSTLPSCFKFAWHVSDSEELVRCGMSGGPSHSSWWNTA